MPIQDSSPHRSNRINWGTVAAITGIMSISGGALISLGKTMFASKDEYIQLQVHVKESDEKTQATFTRLEKATDKLADVVLDLNTNIIKLNTRAEEQAERRRR